MAKRTALVSATQRPVDQEAWVTEKPRIDHAQPDEKLARLTVEIPADLHRQLKGKCGMEGTKIRDVIQRLLEEYLAEKHESA